MIYDVLFSVSEDSNRLEVMKLVKEYVGALKPTHLADFMRRAREHTVPLASALDERSARSLAARLMEAGAEVELVPCDESLAHRLSRLQHVADYEGLGDVACTVCYSPDGTLVAAGCDSGPGPRLIVWDAHSGRVRWIPPEVEPVERVTFTPDGKRLIAASLYSTRTWTLEQDQPDDMLRRAPSRAPAGPPAFSADGRVCVFPIGMDVEVITPARTYGIFNYADVRADDDEVNSVAVSADGELAAMSNEGLVKIWNVETGNVIRALRRPERHDALAFAPDPTRLAGARDGGGTIILDVQDGGELAVVGCGLRLSFTAGGRFLAGWCWSGSRHERHDWHIQIWDTHAAVHVDDVIVPDAQDGCLAFAPEARALAVGQGNRVMGFAAPLLDLE